MKICTVLTVTVVLALGLDVSAGVLKAPRLGDAELGGRAGEATERCLESRAYSAWARGAMYQECADAFKTGWDDRRHGWQNEYWGKTMLCYALHKNLGTALQASGIAAEMLMMQNSSLSGACIYDARCGVDSFSPLFNPMTLKPHKAYYAFTAFNELRKLGVAVKVSCPSTNITAAAAAKGDRVAVMLANPSDLVLPVSLDVPGCRFASCRLTDETHTDDLVGALDSLQAHSLAVVIFAKRNRRENLIK